MIKNFYLRHIPHKTKSGSHWCVPIWLVWIVGGNYDSGNGYGWRPNLYHMIRRYYREGWNKEKNYTLYTWIFK
jgi:hypothetical protein